MQVIHTKHSFIYSIGNGILRERSVLEVDNTDWTMIPIVASDTWIDGVPDRGYAIEALREGLGLNLEYLTAIMDEDLEDRE